MQDMTSRPTGGFETSSPRAVRVWRGQFEYTLRRWKGREIGTWEAKWVLGLSGEQLDQLQRRGRVFYVSYVDPLTLRREDHYYLAEYRFRRVQVSRLLPSRAGQSVA